jgi:hypothetical protein
MPLLRSPLLRSPLLRSKRSNLPWPLTGCLLWALAAGCTGEESVPTAPGMNSWAGVYSRSTLGYGVVDGVRAADSQAAGGHCLVSFLFAQAWPQEVELRQTGDLVEGTVKDVGLGFRCSLRGRVDADGTIRWEQSDCTPRCFDLAIRDRCDLQVCPSQQVANGIRGVLSLDSTIQWDTTDRATGQRRRIAMAGVLSLNR